MKTKPIKAWIAKDKYPTLGAIGTMLFVGEEPKLYEGYWYQGQTGRWPIPNVLEQKPGEIARVTITEETT